MPLAAEIISLALSEYNVTSLRRPMKCSKLWVTSSADLVDTGYPQRKPVSMSLTFDHEGTSFSHTAFHPQGPCNHMVAGDQIPELLRFPFEGAAFGVLVAHLRQLTSLAIRVLRKKRQ